MSNLETVQSIYEAFGRGDVPTILDQLADYVMWEQWDDNTAQNAGYVLLTERQGKAGAAAFFEAVMANAEVLDFEVRDFLASDRQVVADVVIEVRLRSTGNVYRDEELHLWSFDGEGKVARMRHYTDTAKHLEAAGLVEIPKDVVPA